MILPDERHGCGRYAPDLFFLGFIEMGEKVICQDGDVQPPLPKGGQMDRYDIDSIKEVLPEPPIGNGLFEILVCSSNDPDIRLDCLYAADTLKLFFLNDPKFYPLWSKIQELAVAIMVHTGTIQGQGRQHLKYNKPVPYLDDIAADFPGLTIIACHPSFPWQDETLAVATHKKNVFIELSAGYPEDFSDNLVKFMGKGLQDKIMFGSGYPLFEPEEWIKQFRALPLSKEVQEKVLFKNAAKFFGLK